LQRTFNHNNNVPLFSSHSRLDASQQMVLPMQVQPALLGLASSLLIPAVHTHPAVAVVTMGAVTVTVTEEEAAAVAAMVAAAAVMVAVAVAAAEMTQWNGRAIWAW
jgi:hypothetical protein